MNKFLSLLAVGSFSCLAVAAPDAVKEVNPLLPPVEEALPPPPPASLGRPDFRQDGATRQRQFDREKFAERDSQNRKKGEGRNYGKKGRMRDNRFREQMLWRVFNSLNEQEKQEMMKLQRENPEKFRSIMREKTEILMRERRIKMQQIRKLVSDIRVADGEKKAELTKALKAAIRKDYEERLAGHRRHIAEMKERTAKLEKELEERSSKIDAEVDKISEGMIRGDEPGDKSEKPHYRPKNEMQK